MDREEFHRLLDADIDGEATPDDRARLAEAVGADPELAREAVELRRLRAIFAAAPPATAPEGFSASVMRAVGAPAASGSETSGTAEAPSRPRLRLLRALPWVAGVAAAALLAVMLGPWADDDHRAAVATAAADRAPAFDELESRSQGDDDRDGKRAYTERLALEAEVGEASRSRLRAPAESAPAPTVEPADLPVRENSAETKTASGVAAEPAAGDPADRAGGRRAREKRVAAEDELGGVADAEAGAGPTTGGGGGVTKPVATPPEAPTSPAADAGRESGEPLAKKESGGARDDAPDRFSSGKGAADESQDDVTAKRKQARPEKHYVVFEDEVAARRYLAELQAAERLRLGDDASRDAASGPRAPGAEDSGPTTGSGAGARGATPRSLAQVAPRVLGRVTLPASSPVAERAITRRPAGAGFGRDVDPSVLAAAERFVRPGGGLAEGFGIGGGSAGRAGADTAGAGDAADGGDGNPEQPESEEPPAEPQPAAEEAAGAVDPVRPPRTHGSKTGTRAERSRPARAIEVVIVIAPPGSLRTKGASPR